MNKGFTVKELIITLFILGLISLLAIHIFSNSNNTAIKENLLEQARVYITSLNTEIITSQNENKNILYQTYLPMNIGETVTFNIENIRINNTNTYKGIIKVTYINSNQYEYKIAIHNNLYMIGTEEKLISEKDLDKSIITKYDKNLFY